MTQTENQIVLARITSVHRERYAVESGAGEAYARLKSSAFRAEDAQTYPTVGDYVDMLYNPAGDSLIVAVRPRKSLFTRKTPGITVGEQAVAANFDEVFILSSLNLEWNPRRLERYAALAWQSGGTPVVVLTKLDIAQGVAEKIAEAQVAMPGAFVYAVSAATGEGMEALRARLSPGKTAVLLGSSGVGKSTLVNALAGETLMRTSEIREDDARGRHTTTHRELLTLPGGAFVIDTPGMRELGLWDAEEGLKEAFDDIAALAWGCRFADCSHGPEPGCAVRQAVMDGLLSEKRLVSYQRLKREAERRAKLQKWSVRKQSKGV